jgi:hypothetical protein
MIMRLNITTGCCFAVLLFCLVPLVSVQARVSKNTEARRKTDPAAPLKVGGGRIPVIGLK